MIKVKCKYTIRKPIGDILVIAVFVLYVTVYEMFSPDWQDLDLEAWAKVKCKHNHRKPISDFLCVGNGNVFSICHRLRDNHV